MRELLERVDGRELAEWEAFFALEPFGPGVEDERWAALMAMTANAAGAKARPEQFRLGWRPPEPTQDQAAVIRMLRGIQRAWGN